MTGRLPATRRSRILEYVSANGEASVVELAGLFGVSEDTVRRDLEHLDLGGGLTRTRGGAFRNPPTATFDSVAVRRSSHSDAKRIIGELAVKLVADNETVLMNGGTTTLEVAQALGERRGLTVITPSPAIAQAVPLPAARNVYLTGGRWYPEFEVAIGPIRLPGTTALNADTVILGAVGLSVKGGVTIPNPEEAEMFRNMIDSASRFILVMDSSKFGRTALVKIAELDEVDVLVTEHLDDIALADALTRADVEIIKPAVRL